ncbi:FAM133A protein, partial [Tanacetum coccineum]
YSSFSPCIKIQDVPSGRDLYLNNLHTYKQHCTPMPALMKTFSETVVFTKPISLSKATKILSNFANIENRASESVFVYLRRASVAFDELEYFKCSCLYQAKIMAPEGSKDVAVGQAIAITEAKSDQPTHVIKR